MSKPKAAPQFETILPARNFTISLAERVKALDGPPAFVTRKRTIEDLEEWLVEHLANARARGGEEGLEAATTRRAFTMRFARMNALIDSHNRYYPCEANLPMDPRTGAMLERGSPWKPLETRTVAMLVEGARKT